MRQLRRRIVQSRLRTAVVVVLVVAVPLIPLWAQTVSDLTLGVETWVSGLDSPTTMEFLDSDNLLVLQKGDGKVIHVVSRTPRPTPALDVPVNESSERGLLGIAINTENPPRVFLYYTEAATDGGAPLGNRVYRYTWNAGLGVLESPQLILDLPSSPGPNHDGGIVLLGPTPTPGPGQVGDGSLLYVVIGELNRNGQLQNNPGGSAPDDTGVIFRVRQDGTAAPGNPFVPYCSVTTSQTCPGGGGCPGGETCLTQVARYLAYGVRNSFGMALDPMTGNLWDTENGPGSYDEVNLVLPGLNSGWNQIMGPDSRDPQGLGDLFNMPGGASVYSDPEFSWVTTVAPTSIVFPVGSALGAAYDDVALVGDNNFGQIYRFPLNAMRSGFDLSGFTGLSDLVADSAAERNAVRLGTGFGVVTDLQVGPDGALYAVDLIGGSIYRIAAETPTGPTATPTATPTPTSTSQVPPTSTPPAAPTCPLMPQACRAPFVPGAAQVILKNRDDDNSDSLLWKWNKGAMTLKAEFGDPVNSHAYELCIYDGSGLIATASAPANGTCGAAACWKETGSGFKYKDKELSPDGLKKMVLKEGADGRSRIIVQGTGVDLDMPNLATLTSPLTVQLLRSGSSICWGATYSFPPATRNEPEIFKDTAD